MQPTLSLSKPWRLTLNVRCKQRTKPAGFGCRYVIKSHGSANRHQPLHLNSDTRDKRVVKVAVAESGTANSLQTAADSELNEKVWFHNLSLMIPRYDGDSVCHSA